MRLRRVFLLGAAALASCAAVVAIAAILNGHIGETEGAFFATLAAAFVAGSAAIAGIACLERGEARPLGFAGVVLACGGFVLWAEQIWAQHDSELYWKVLGLLLIWTLTTLVVTTTRLMTRSRQLLRTLYPATVLAAGAAGAAVSTIVLRQNGDGWQLFAVFLILALLGQVLTPILQRFVVTTDETVPRERVLGTVAGVAVLAVRTNSRRRLVHLGGREISLEDDEMLVVRPA